jgi:predicted dehydrogenase
VTSSNIAIIGTRGHYEQTLREVSQTPGANIAAVAPGGAGDDDVTPLLDANPAVYPDLQSLLGHPELDVLVVCGPFELHATTSIAAIERGIHVLTEKPAALTLAELQRLSDALKQHPGVHFAGMMFSRYDPGFFTAHQLIQGGAIGEVRLINARKSYRFGKRSDYFYKRETYGGTIPWVGSHAIDWVMWFADQPVSSIYATHSSDTPERAALCHLTFTNNIFASVSIDYHRPDNAPTHGDDWARVVGTAGVMEIRPGSVQLMNAANDGSKPVEARCERRLVPDFLAHASGAAKALIDRYSTIGLTRVCLLARESADAGRVLHIDRSG